jgi:hypothetical protein
MFFVLIWIFTVYDTIKPSENVVLNTFIICGTAIGMNLMATNIGGACLNPLIALSLALFASVTAYQ